MEKGEIVRAHRWFAVECNNRAWELASLKERSAAEDREMLLNACASALHWADAKNETNDARASVLLASVFGRLGIGAQAMAEAKQALEFFLHHPDTDWDMAFAHSAAAWAGHASGDAAFHAKHFNMAQKVAGMIADEDDQRFVLEELALVPAPESFTPR